MIKSTARINAIIDFISDVNILYDICCDHGLIGLNALIANKANSVVFIDISLPSLNKVKFNLDKVSDKISSSSIELVHLDAINYSFINTEENCLVIAGIGAHLLVKILNNECIQKQKLILVPHSHSEVLESYLTDKEIRFSKSSVKEKSRSYPIFLVK
ncbi:class I SAM-dependent methyltransferase [Bacteriovoracaceae bacterium]|nr:class I SAM-dependent methyltransferase [Bacteriovoracaceae bacterium]